MTRYLTKGQLIAMGPCFLGQRLEKFGNRNRLTVRQAFKAGFDLGDLIWVAGQLGLRDELIRFTQECVDRVKHLDTVSARFTGKAAETVALHPKDAAEDATRAVWSVMKTVRGAAKTKAARDASRSDVWTRSNAVRVAEKAEYQALVTLFIKIFA